MCPCTPLIIMPRPGPRPYECVRRAWHSDSHQALRGSLIQEIFRLVNELHSTSTRRKKEWQEKLPIVVLRAEEILYTKANSEGEYADVATLKSRLDDAVNMMIRREDGEEEGVYLVPCVEALSLGCTPKRGTRGERQGSSRQHLNAAKRVSLAASPAVMEDGTALTISIDYTRISQDKYSNTTYNLMSTRALPMQEQEIRLVAHPSNSAFFSPAAAFWSPTPTTTTLIPLQTPTFYRSPEVSNPAGASSFPKPGALVQFLRTTDACISTGLPCSGLLCSLPQAQFNLNQGSRPLQLLDAAESSGAIKGSILPYADGSVRAPTNSPPCTSVKLLQDAKTDSSVAANRLYKPSRGSVVASSFDSAPYIAVQNSHPSVADKGLNFQLKECLSLPGSGHGSSMSLLPDLCKGYKTAIVQQNSAGTLFGVDDKSASPSGVHDLQLRLGPPINEPIASPDDASAQKRKRVAVIDVPHIRLL